MLRRLIGERFDYFPDELTETDHIDDLKGQLDRARRKREEALRYPERPDALGRTTVPAFHFIERGLADETVFNQPEGKRGSVAVYAGEGDCV
jgi:hypothetical protein